MINKVNQHVQSRLKIRSELRKFLSVLASTGIAENMDRVFLYPNDPDLFDTDNFIGTSPEERIAMEFSQFVDFCLPTLI